MVLKKKNYIYLLNILLLKFSIGRDFPGPGAQNRVLANPMREFFHSDDSHTHTQFEDFKKKHGKEYTTELEHQERKNIFRQSLRFFVFHLILKRH